MNEDTRSQLERDFDEGKFTSSVNSWQVEQLAKLVTILQKERDAFRSNWRASERAYKEADPLRALAQIADLLELVVDKEKKAICMVDIERANVYKTHLGEKLVKTDFGPIPTITKGGVQ